jgi:hypothetical protein
MQFSYMEGIFTKATNTDNWNTLKVFLDLNGTQ